MSLLYDLHVVDNLAGTLLDRAMSTEGSVPPFDFAVYSLLIGRAMTPGQIAGEMSLRPSTISGVLQRMEDLGHAVRVPNPHDARSRIVELTEDGRAAHAKAAMRFGDVAVPLRAELGEDFDGVLWSLHRLDHALQTMDGNDPGAIPARPASGGDPFDGLVAADRAHIDAFAEYLQWRRRQERSRTNTR